MKIDDKVKVLPGATYTGGTADVHGDYAGLVGKVVDSEPDVDGDWLIAFDTRLSQYFDPEFLEPVGDDPVSPSHYSAGMPDGVEVIDIIRAQEADYLHGNLIKYVLRWKYKNGVTDLKKGRKYIDWLIEQEEKNND